MSSSSGLDALLSPILPAGMTGRTFTLWAVLVVLLLWLGKLLHRALSRRLHAMGLFRKSASIPTLPASLKKDIETATKEMVANVEDASIKPVRSLPSHGWQYNAIIKRLEKMMKIDQEKKISGKFSGQVFDSSKEIVTVNQESSSKFLFCNLLFYDLHASSLQMDDEVISMMIRILNGKGKASGVTTTGNCESSLLAVLAYRRYYWSKGIIEPELVLSEAAHPSLYKACEFMNVKPVVVPIDKNTGAASLEDFKSRVTCNTIAICCSAPDQIFGQVDPVQELAAFAKSKGIGLHLDATLGGFIYPFLEDPKSKPQPMDFTVDGITSISVEPQSYGCAALGIGVLMFSQADIQKAMYWGTASWCGYLYASATFLGSKACNSIASAWATLQYTGTKVYSEAAEKIVEQTKSFSAKLREIQGIKVIGNPWMGVIAFRPESVDTFALGQWLENKGWSVDPLQAPALQLIITHTNLGQLKELAQLLKKGVEEVKIAAPTLTGRWSLASRLYQTAKTNPSLANEAARHFLSLTYQF
jgi:sphinganine-1-phosphate aldolase